jgi:cytochrome c
MKLSASVLVALVLAAAPARAEETGDPAAGEKVFAKCKICHQIGEGAKNMVGPVLNGVIGRKSATYPGFAYSPAYKKAGEAGMIQDHETITRWLKGPSKFVPGNKMAFAGLPADKDIADVLAYIAQFGPDGKKQ